MVRQVGRPYPLQAVPVMRGQAALDTMVYIVSMDVPRLSVTSPRETVTHQTYRKVYNTYQGGY